MQTAIAACMLALVHSPHSHALCFPLRPMCLNRHCPRAAADDASASAHGTAYGGASGIPPLNGPCASTRRRFFQTGVLSATAAILPSAAFAVATEATQAATASAAWALPSAAPVGPIPYAAGGELAVSAAAMLLRTLPYRSAELLSVQDALETCGRLLATGSNTTWFVVREAAERAEAVLLNGRPAPALSASSAAWLDFFKGEARPGLAPFSRPDDTAAVAASRKQRAAAVTPRSSTELRLSFAGVVLVTSWRASVPFVCAGIGSCNCQPRRARRRRRRRQQNKSAVRGPRRGRAPCRPRSEAAITIKATRLVCSLLLWGVSIK